MMGAAELASTVCNHYGKFSFVILKIAEQDVQKPLDESSEIYSSNFMLTI